MNQFASKVFIIILMLFNFSFISITGVNAHKFYLSLTEIRLNASNEMIEISMRIFPDDLDRAIEMATGENPRILTKFEHDSADAWIMEYLERNFNLWINGTKINCTYLGKEAESDAAWCYLEAPLPGSPDNVKVECRLLTELFEDQKNIVQVYYREYNQGALLDRNLTNKIFTIIK